MIGLNVTLNNSFRLNTYSATVAEVKKGLKGWAVEVGVPLANRQIEQRLRNEPGRPRYPLRWKSERQRRYVMAKLRAQNNLPYQRTHALVRAWNAEARLAGGEGSIVAQNPAPMAGFVYAPYEQQPFHQDTGWADVRPIFTVIGAEQAASLIGYWPKIVHESVFK